MKELSDNAQLALDTILRKRTRGIPTYQLFLMEHRIIDMVAGEPEGTYRKNPENTYLKMLWNSGACMVDQYIPDNPLSIGDTGYDVNTEKGATTGAKEVVLDGIRIDSPDAVVEHLEREIFPELLRVTKEFDEDECVRDIIAGERDVQAKLGKTILKSGYYVGFPGLYYGQYGYENYFMAYALYPEVMEKHFSLQADFNLLRNRAALRAVREGGLPPLVRLDHDMADSRGTLVDIKSLDRIWFPHFARCLEPLLKGGVRLIWHCDGNLSEMVPRLLEVGLSGFQGFQYEDGMDYEKICAMKTTDGDSLIIIAGVSVTQTLPYGKPGDVRRQMKWLVDKGPKTGLFLGCTSSVTPGVPRDNVKALIEGFKYYREHGRD